MIRSQLPGAPIHILALNLCLLFFCPGLTAQKDQTFGLKLAYPLKPPTLGDTDSILKCAEDEFVRLQLRVDVKGAVSKVIYTDVATENRMREYNLFFKLIRFQPGTRNGAPVAQLIPVELYLFTDHRTPDVTFPVSSDGLTKSSRLYWQALELNGITLPHLLTFPSYHSTLFGVDTTVIPPNVLAAIDLGSDGSPTAIHLAHTTYPNFASQILNAANWATYSPARIDTLAVPSTFFLLVTYFPTVAYPTKPLALTWPDTFTSISHEKLAVTLLPDTLNYLSGPIPRLVDNWVYPVAPTPGAWKAHGIFRYKIEKDGMPYLISGGNGSVAAKRVGDALAQAMRFYPATNKWGHPVSFEGVVKVQPETKSNVRVKFLWLQ